MGIYSDYYGRKSALQLSVGTMAAATTLLGLLPTYHDIGVFATVLLVVCRLIQGLSVGGQFIGATIFMVESAPPSQKGLFGAVAFGSSSSGTLLGATLVTVCKGRFSHDALLNHGWRVPFLISAVVGAIGYALQSWAEEVPTHGSAQALESTPTTKEVLEEYRDVFQCHGYRIFCVACAGSLAPCAFYTYFLFVPILQTELISPAMPRAALVTTFMLGVSIAVKTTVGYLVDLRLGDAADGDEDITIASEWYMKRGATALALLSPPIFYGLASGDVIIAGFCHLLATLAFCMFDGSLPVWLVHMFPPKLRASALGLAWNLSAAIVGGLAPATAVLLVRETGSAGSPGYLVCFFACISLLALHWLDADRRHHATMTAINRRHSI